MKSKDHVLLEQAYETILESPQVQQGEELVVESPGRQNSSQSLIKEGSKAPSVKGSKHQLKLEQYCRGLLNSAFLQEKYYSFEPSKNIRTRIYDFYVLSYLEFLVTRMPVKNMRDEDTELKASIIDAHKKCAKGLREELLNDVASSISGEAGYQFSEGKYKPDNFRPFGLKILPKSSIELFNSIHSIIPNDYDPDVSGKGEQLWNIVSKHLDKIGVPAARYINLCHQLFDEDFFDWDEGYGGGAWQDICEGWLKLNESNPFSAEEQVAIDHIFDLQHNNGSVLDKLSKYTMVSEAVEDDEDDEEEEEEDISADDYEGDYDAASSIEWLQRVLDHKRDAKNMYELLAYASGPVRSMAERALKERTGSTVQQSGVDRIQNSAAPMSTYAKSPQAKSPQATAETRDESKHSGIADKFAWGEEKDINKFKQLPDHIKYYNVLRNPNFRTITNEVFEALNDVMRLAAVDDIYIIPKLTDEVILTTSEQEKLKGFFVTNLPHIIKKTNTAFMRDLYAPNYSSRKDNKKIQTMFDEVISQYIKTAETIPNILKYYSPVANV